MKHLRSNQFALSLGDVIFTTIHKFASPPPEKAQSVVSDRRNAVLIAHESHRSRYDFLVGLARRMRDALPRASFIGLAGARIERKGANARAVGDDIDSTTSSRRWTSRPRSTSGPSFNPPTHQWARGH